MKILNITGQKPFSTGSGVYQKKLMNCFKEFGHENILICGIYQGEEKQFNSNEKVYPVFFKTKKLPFPIPGMSDEMPYESTVFSTMTFEMFQKYETAFLEKIKYVIEKEKPDLIISNHLYLITSKIADTFPNIKIFSICHGSDLRQIKKNSKNRKYILENIPKLDHIFALHENQKKEIINLYKVSENKVTVIGSGFDNEIFNMDNKEKRLKNTIVYAGKISFKKGVLSLINSLKYLNYKDPVTVYLLGGYGNEEEYKKIETASKKQKANIIFTGPLSQKEVAKYFRKAETFVLPSFYEGLPLVNLEAIACGCKVVCTNLPGIKDWYDENLKGNNIIYVKVPKMENVDDIKKEDLKEFEKDLSNAIKESFNSTYKNLNLENLTFHSVAKKILNTY